MQKSLFLALAATASLLAHTATAAQEQEYVNFSAGAFNIDDSGEANFGIEYRGESFWYDLLPIAGVQINEEGGLYGYVGLNYDWNAFHNFYITPTVAVGAYEDNDSVDLGGVLEFRSGLELSYRFANSHRLGLSYHHISNAGIYDRNPGVEQVMLNYAIPVTVFK